MKQSENDEIDLSINLDEKDSAIVMKTDGTFKLLIPPMEDDEVVPENVLMMLAIANRLEQDPTFANEMFEWFKNFTDIDGDDGEPENSIPVTNMLTPMGMGNNKTWN